MSEIVMCENKSILVKNKFLINSTETLELEDTYENIQIVKNGIQLFI